MIISRLAGGLGNQLFQYAFGRRLAYDSGVDLALDISYYAQDPQRNYALAAFPLKARLASEKEIADMIGGNRVTRKLSRVLGRYGLSPFVEEKEFHFSAAAVRPRKQAYLEGYWQSEKYFRPIAQELRGELSLELSAQACSVLAEIECGPSVSIHVRRGDYVGSQFANLDAAYYAAALEHMTGRVFLFSDDVPWAMEHLSLPSDTVAVSGRGFPDAEELILMSRCNGHIIANSSYSWWGAWLDPRPSKKVIAPSRWFAHDRNDTSDLIPADWKIIAA